MLTIPAVSVFSYGADPGYANPDEELLTETGEGTGLDAFLPEEADTDYSTGTPWLCSMIDGTVTADTPADPGDDFYLYVNKDKLLSIELTDQRPEIGTLLDVQYKVDEDIWKACSPAGDRRTMTPGSCMTCITWRSTGSRGMPLASLR